MRELRTCPVEGHTVVINDAIRAAWAETLPLPPVAQGPYPTPVLGVEGKTTVRTSPWVFRDGLGAHERITGDLPSVLVAAKHRMLDLRQDVRLVGFGLGGVWTAEGGLDLVALPFEHPLSAPAGWRDAELGGPRCLEVRESAVAILAWAPVAPMACWVLPRTGRRRFDDSEAQAWVGELAEVWLGKIQSSLGCEAMSVRWVDGEPWRLEILPIVAPNTASIAAGMPVHGSFPERAAAWLLTERRPGSGDGGG